ncbi:MAG TPA: Gfo/Idh/MocA family oxidoreductase [Streptomyces sp.]
MRAAVIGLGSRAETWARGLSERGTLAAFCDTSAHRMAVHNRWLAVAGQRQVPGYGPEGFTRMLAEQAIDTVVVCTPDAHHTRYVLAALAVDLDVVVEKPLATTLADLAAVVRAQAASRGTVRVAFNYRYNPAHSAVRELLTSGAVGEIGSVHFEWCLDTHHGADYFRRWHRRRTASGGLLVHKSSHHFDLVGWWLQADPARVTAEGRLFAYGPSGAQAGHGAFAFDLHNSPRLADLYAGTDDGYRRDHDVFAPGVDIEDDMAVLVRWSSGATMTYHLHAYSPWEGYRLAVNGSHGRLELEVEESAWARPGAGQAAVRLSGAPDRGRMRWRIVVRPLWQAPYEVPVPPVSGAHGGGDERMLADLLDGVASGAPADPLGRAAGLRDGVRAAVTGLAADESLTTGQAVDAAGRLREVLNVPSATSTAPARPPVKEG